MLIRAANITHPPQLCKGLVQGDVLFANRRFLSCFLGPHLLQFRFVNRLCAARLELLHAASGVYQFLFARVERMAMGTDLNFDFCLRGAHGELVAACADDASFGEINWVDILFHTCVW